MYHTLSGNPVPAIITVLIVQAPQNQIRMPLRQKAFENKGRSAVRGEGHCQPGHAEPHSLLSCTYQQFRVRYITQCKTDPCSKIICHCC
jgi:hypothetical protein